MHQVLPQNPAPLQINNLLWRHAARPCCQQTTNTAQRTGSEQPGPAHATKGTAGLQLPDSPRAPAAGTGLAMGAGRTGMHMRMPGGRSRPGGSSNRARPQSQGAGGWRARGLCSGCWPSAARPAGAMAGVMVGATGLGACTHQGLAPWWGCRVAPLLGVG